MKKITLLLTLFAIGFVANAQVKLIEENFQNWTAQATSGTYSITKTLADGVTSGTFTSDKLIVAPSQTIGSAGTNGGASPTVGRAVIGSTAGYLELPMLPTIGRVEIKANIGTDLRTMKLQVKNGEAFEDISGTTTEIRKDLTLLYTFEFTYAGPTTIRIVTSNSSLNLWDLVVYSYVSNLPQVGVPTVGTASNVNAETFTANWTPVTNASGYEVRVYQGTDLITTASVDGQTADNVFVKGLWINTTYTYKVVAKGDGLTTSNSDESAASAEFTTLGGLNSIQTDFDDGTWGTLYTSENQPVSGSFPSSFINNFDFLKAFLYQIPKYDLRDERRENGIRTDRQSNGGMIILPIVNSISQLEIHAIPGGAPRDFVIKEFVGGNWQTVSTQTLTTTNYEEFIIALSRTVPTKLRIENAGSGQITFYHIAVRPTIPALLPSPTVGAASDIFDTKFTANWTPVANATGYKVRVYQGTNLVATVDAAGQATSSVEVNGLVPITEYTYKVLAVGDGFINFADSYISTPSALFPTTNTTAVQTAEKNVIIYASNGNIISSMPGNIEVYGMQGKLIFSAEIKNSLPVQFVKGLYLVRLTSSDGFVYNSKINIR